MYIHYTDKITEGLTIIYLLQIFEVSGQRFQIKVNVLCFSQSLHSVMEDRFEAWIVGAVCLF